MGSGVPSAVLAQFTGRAFATGQFENNSNVFDLNSGEPVGLTGGARGGDSYYAYGGGFDTHYLWGLQDFHVLASAKEFDYQHFTGLDHSEYNIDTSLKWILSRSVDGTLQVTRIRSMVPFFDVGLTQLVLQTDQREFGELGLTLVSDWRVEGSAYTRKDEEPTQGSPNLELTETSGKAAIKYLGINQVTSGAFASYTTGTYQGAISTVDPSYHQDDAGLTATYLSSRSSTEGSIGYSRRVSATGLDDTAGTTGAFSFKDKLTPKTTLIATVSRSINNYVINAGSEIDTGGGVNLTWQATYKLQVTAGYTYTNRNYPRQGNNPIGSDRVDHQQYANLQIDYQPVPWLTIRPYAKILTRNSDFIGGDFNSTVFGVMFTVSTSPPLTPKR